MDESQQTAPKLTSKKLITKHQFYFDTPLYELLSIDEIDTKFMEGDVDGYNHIGGFDTTYSINSESMSYLFRGFYRVVLTCKRNETDMLRFFIAKDKDWIMKVGQLPSLADIQFAELIGKYERVLNVSSLAEFKRAIGLAAHGVGVGSFVYLRRIFERLIIQTFDVHKNSLNTEKKDFLTMRMEDKVTLLKEYLPSQLVEMKSVYSILSKGIHELDENECLAYFKPLKLSIELILDQKIEMNLKKERDERVKQEIQNIQTKLSKNK